MDNKKIKVCILSFSNIAWDSRVLREINLARKHYQVDVIGYGEWDTPENVRFFQLKRKMIFPPLKYALLIAGLIQRKYFDNYYWLKPQYKQAYQILIDGEYDLIHANDWDALPIASKYGDISSAKILFDAHEFNLAININLPFPKLFKKYWYYLFEKYASSCDRKITVAQSVADLYNQYFPWKFDIVLNVPEYQKIEYKKTKENQIEIVHCGGAMPGRFLEAIISMLDFLDDRFRIHLYLIPTFPNYLAKLKIMGEQYGNKIVFHEPIPPDKLIKELSQYDIGIPMVKAESESYIHSLPNKFFEYIMAGLMICVSEFPMMIDFLKNYQIGIWTNDHSSETLAKRINMITFKEINQYRKNALEAAKEFNAEVEMKKLRNIYEDLLS